MPPRTDHAFQYDDVPLIPVRVISFDPPGEAVIEALIDTGSDVTIFDSEVARLLRLELSDWPTLRFRGIGGEPQEAAVVELELLPLFEESLSVTISVAFVDRLKPTFDNLIGRDVLEYLDFALTHSTRVGYLGRTETLV